MNTDEVKHFIRPNVRIFFKECLLRAHEYRQRYYNTIFNLVMGFILVAGVSLALAYLYKGKLSPEEKAKREQQKKQEILDLIHRFHDKKLKEQQNLLSGLPIFVHDYEMVPQAVR